MIVKPVQFVEQLVYQEAGKENMFFFIMYQLVNVVGVLILKEIYLNATLQSKSNCLMHMLEVALNHHNQMRK